jgi:hypothetical protein
MKKTKKGEQCPSLYFSPNELAERWRCARSSVDRIAKRAGLKRLYLGEGKNGIVRFIREEVEAYEASRLVHVSHYKIK